MKISALRAAAAATPPETAHRRGPQARGQAHGLVRKLEADTFNGASADQLRARFAHRLSGPPAPDPAPTLDGGPETTDAPALDGGPETTDAPAMDGGSTPAPGTTTPSLDVTA